MEWGQVITIIFGVSGFMAIFMFLTNKRIDSLEKRFDDVNRRFNDVNSRLDKIEEDIREIRQILYKIVSEPVKGQSE